MCTVLSVGQRCADWFVPRQFRITGKNAGKILIENANGKGRERTHADAVVEDFCDGWFSAKASTEPMMRGSANEGAVLKAMERMPFLQVVYECGMLGIKV